MLFEKIKDYSKTDLIALANGSESVSYRELYRQLAKNQRRLPEIGFYEGDVVMLRLECAFDYIVAFLSLLAASCWVIPIPPDMTPEEYGKVLSHHDAKLFDENSRALLMKQKGVFAETDITSLETGGIYHMTSGSTALPRLCMRTTKSLELEGETFAAMYRLQSGERIMSAPPVYHSYALGAALMAALVSGATLFIMNSFVPRQLLKIADRYKMNIILLVPIMAKALCNTRSKQVYSLDSVRIALVGAGPVTAELNGRMKQMYGIDLYANYGSTETGGIISRLSKEPVGSIGKPMDATRIKICDADKRLVKPGETGQLWVKSAYMMERYVAAGQPVFDEEGFICQGDLAYEDAEGFVFIVGRVQPLINIGGKKVNPLEVEAVVMEYPGIRECLVLGNKKSNGEEEVLLIAAGKGLAAEEIYNHCIKSLSRYKCPSDIKVVSRLPRNDMGKIIRQKALKELYSPEL